MDSPLSQCGQTGFLHFSVIEIIRNTYSRPSRKWKHWSPVWSLLTLTGDSVWDKRVGTPIIYSMGETFQACTQLKTPPSVFLSKCFWRWREVVCLFFPCISLGLDAFLGLCCVHLCMYLWMVLCIRVSTYCGGMCGQCDGQMNRQLVRCKWQTVSLPFVPVLKGMQKGLLLDRCPDKTGQVEGGLKCSEVQWWFRGIWTFLWMTERWKTPILELSQTIFKLHNKRAFIVFKKYVCRVSVSVSMFAQWEWSIALIAFPFPVWIVVASFQSIKPEYDYECECVDTYTVISHTDCQTTSVSSWSTEDNNSLCCSTEFTHAVILR